MSPPTGHELLGRQQDRLARRFDGPVRCLQQRDIEYDDFTDSGVTGTLALTKPLPDGAILLGWKATVETAFTGGTNTTAVIAVGDGSTADCYSPETDPSVFAANILAGACLNPDDINTSLVPYTDAQVALTLTITVDADYTTISAGKLHFTLYYAMMEPGTWASVGHFKDKDGRLIEGPVRCIQQDAISYDDFTDGGGASGTLILTKPLPDGAIVLGWAANVSTAFTSAANTSSCVLAVGDGSTADIFSPETDPSIMTANIVARTCLNPDDINANLVPHATAETAITLTVTEDSDFGQLTQGEMDFTLFYILLEDNVWESMGWQQDADGRHMKGALRCLQVTDLDYSDMTASTNDGYYDIPEQLPDGAIVLGWKAHVTTAFAGGTTGTLAVGTSSVADRFSPNTDPSVYAADILGRACLNPNDINANLDPGADTALTVRLFITGGAAWTGVSAGKMEFTLYYLYMED
ncbi:MAG TPA: hypothetical protein VM238_04525 [Phycisphaerae bacterium]|nr:hypothetical protein [Phycisphaerae bacterium]